MKLSLMENICGGLPTLKMFLSRFISALKYSGGSADSSANMNRSTQDQALSNDKISVREV
jgi:hypothetical protein